VFECDPTVFSAIFLLAMCLFTLGICLGLEGLGPSISQRQRLPEVSSPDVTELPGFPDMGLALVSIGVGRSV